MMSRPAWGAWIETLYEHPRKTHRASRPAWGAWIETLMQAMERIKPPVAPRMGRVD